MEPAARGPAGRWNGLPPVGPACRMIHAMVANTASRLLGLAVVVLLLGGCRGGGDETTSVTDDISLPPLARQKPDAPRPVTHYPPELRPPDAAFNRFVEQFLESCEWGDYDRFCGSFASTATPPGLDDFKRVWHGVKDISVTHLYSGSRDPEKPEYYVHAVVHLRDGDNRGRTRRDAVIWAFKENGEWRMSPAPAELAGKVLAAASQPVGGEAESAESATSAAAPDG